MDLPYIGDINLRRNWNLPEKTRRGNWERQRRYLARHALDRLKKVPAFDARPPGIVPTWVIRALVDKDNVVQFIATCRETDSIVGIVDGLDSCREIDLFSGTYTGRTAESLVKSLVSCFKPVGNAPPKPSQSGRGKYVPNAHVRYTAFYAFW
ncbi:MAG: hypothetical protein ABSE63_00945 [Thermoguttaceae bacterium]|jgi:hypothetical protein